MQNAKTIERVERERERERESCNLKNVGADFHVCPIGKHAKKTTLKQIEKLYIINKELKINMLLSHRQTVF